MSFLKKIFGGNGNGVVNKCQKCNGELDENGVCKNCGDASLSTATPQNEASEESAPTPRVENAPGVPPAPTPTEDDNNNTDNDPKAAPALTPTPAPSPTPDFSPASAPAPMPSPEIPAQPSTNPSPETSPNNPQEGNGGIVSEPMSAPKTIPTDDGETSEITNN